MTTKWASPGHFHSLASSDQALAQEAVAQGPGKCWPQMLRCFGQCVSSSKERKGAVWARVGGRLRFPKLHLGAVMPSCWSEAQQATALPSGLKPLVFLTWPTSLGKVPLWELCCFSLLKIEQPGVPGLGLPALRMVELYVAVHLIPEPGLDQATQAMTYLLWQPLLQTRKEFCAVSTNQAGASSPTQRSQGVCLAEWVTVFMKPFARASKPVSQDGLWETE